MTNAANTPAIDPVTLAVVRGALEQIADEMDLNLIHAALSPIISETNDCAHGLYDPETGETIAQGGYAPPDVSWPTCSLRCSV
ncbi:MAG: hydantoinase B/oxoprolinase family protein [Candidatus Saccharibacteria bacterium]|nr:hydantoinase B/oxoprolinase family protein [Pseudorhodobacter sp.]